MIHTIPVKKENYYKAVFMTMSPYLGGLTDYETNLLSEMMNLKIDRLSTENRRRLLNKLNTDTYTLNNYIKKLKDKQVLTGVTRELFINPNITNNINDKTITIKFNVS